MPPALANNEIFYTESMSDAGRLIGRALSPLTLTVRPENAAGFAATMNGIRLRNVSMLYLNLHVAASIDIPALGQYYGVHMPMNGRAVSEHRDQTFESNTIRALVTSPGLPLRLTFDDDSRNC